jgi:hypothetical protein
MCETVPLFVWLIWFGVDLANCNFERSSSKNALAFLWISFPLLRFFLLWLEFGLFKASQKMDEEFYRSWVTSSEIDDESSGTRPLRFRALASSFQYGHWWLGTSIPILVGSALVVLGLMVESQIPSMGLGLGPLTETAWRVFFELLSRFDAIKAVPD